MPQLPEDPDQNERDFVERCRKLKEELDAEQLTEKHRLSRIFEKKEQEITGKMPQYPRE